MFDRIIVTIHFQTAKCKKVSKVQSSIFKYLYSNHSYIAPLLEADASAFATSGHSFNDLYYQLLWTKTGVFTNHLLEESSKTLATLIYSAWCEAGKPKIPATLVKTQ